MKQLRILLALALLGLVMNPAIAGDQVGQVFVSVTGDVVDDDPDRGVEDSKGASFSIGYNYTDAFSVEGFLHYVNLPGDLSVDQTQYEAGFNGMLFFGRDNWLSPYVLAGLSDLYTEFEGGDDDHLLAGNLGAGVMISPTDRFAFRLQYRYRSELAATRFRDNIYSAGFQYGFGDTERTSGDVDADGVSDKLDQCPSTPFGASVDATGCELDSDSDGVVDRLDQCADTPANVRVDGTGCEVKLDSDKDGVADADDQCPRSPAGVRVNANGCEVDSDGDSVVDSKDSCPNTASDVRVDIRGCEIKDVINLPGVNFETNSDNLLAGTERVLQEAAATLRKNADLVVEVAGHTDSAGAAAYNASLSERRARTVRNFLVNEGVNAANLSVKGYGEAEPVADNTTAAGRAENRRVELRLLNR
ncbi:MAG: OmpA family protein [Pseudomonadota bacterium]